MYNADKTSHSGGNLIKSLNRKWTEFAGELGKGDVYMK